MIKVQVKSFAKDTTVISKEDEAANQLKDNLQEELASYPEAKGIIYIMTSIRIFGQKRNDIDMRAMGYIDNLKARIILFLILAFRIMPLNNVTKQSSHCSII